MMKMEISKIHLKKQIRLSRKWRFLDWTATVLHPINTDAVRAKHIPIWATKGLIVARITVAIVFPHLM